MTDVDKTGEVLDVRCVVRKGYADDACDAFQILPRNRETDHDMFRGNVVLRQPLDYRNRQVWSLLLMFSLGKKITDVLQIMICLAPIVRELLIWNNEVKIKQLTTPGNH